MTVADPTRGFAKVWSDYSWKVGYYLDSIGCWLLVHAPALGKAFAMCLSRGRPRLRRYPGWTFAAEYFIERRWTALRRAALWDCALANGLVVPLRMRWYDGSTVDVTLGNDHSLCLYVSGSYEPNEFVFLDRVLAPGMIVFDVGANDGLYSLFAARRVGPTGRVVAVEPSSRERANLQRNIDRNHLKNITVVASALGTSPGRAQLQIAPGLHSGHNTLGSFAYDDVVAINSEPVAVERLDSVVRRLALPRVDFIKIDVEGAEVSVLHGTKNVLTTWRPLLLLEANESTLSAQGTSTEALVMMLRSEFNYQILVFSPATGGLERLAERVPLSANIVAVPDERLSEMLSKSRA
jgi:FkbM family methyltransferase